jgi:hypothetical protein
MRSDLVPRSSLTRRERRRSERRAPTKRTRLADRALASASRPARDVLGHRVQGARVGDLVERAKCSVIASWRSRRRSRRARDVLGHRVQGARVGDLVGRAKPSLIPCAAVECWATRRGGTGTASTYRSERAVGAVTARRPCPAAGGSISARASAADGKFRLSCLDLGARRCEPGEDPGGA